MKRKVLLATNHLKDFAGSEINILQLAQELRILGYEPVVATFIFDYPIKKLFDENKIKVIVLNTELKYQESFEFLWIQHFTVINFLIYNTNVKYKKAIFSCLSPFEYYEAPPIFANELSLVIANSEETKSKLITEGVKNEIIKVLPNSVPSSFFNLKAKKEVRVFKKVAIVSNHIPQEVLDIKKLLDKKGIALDIFGIGYKYKQVTEKELLKFDVIITIGKTVQYGMVLGIPVYCYDKFGGPGWINKSNFRQAEKANFSGRSHPIKKETKQIVLELTKGFLIASKDALFLQEYAYKKYSLNKNLKNIIDNIKKCKIDIFKHYMLQRQSLFFSRELEYRELLNKSYNEEKALANNLETQNTYNSLQIEKLKKEKEILEKYKQDYDLIINSRSWRLLNFFRKKILRKV